MSLCRDEKKFPAGAKTPPLCVFGAVAAAARWACKRGCREPFRDARRALWLRAAENGGKTARRAAEKKPVYYFWKASRERTESERASVNNETYGNVLVKGEERGRGTRCVRTATLPAAAPRKRGNDDASALGCEGYPATHLLYQGDVAVATT